MDCDFIVFGHGHEGALRNTDYNGAAVVEFLPAVIIQGFRPGDAPAARAQPLGYLSFNVLRHRSAIDVKEYLLAIAENENPENIDIKILGESPRTAP